MALAVTIALGLASRRFHTPLPWRVQKESGDVLWAMAAYWAIAICRPGWERWRVASLALLQAILSEASQASHAGWLEWGRSFGIGRLLLGTDFSWLDMAMYPIGAALAWAVDEGIKPRQTALPARSA